MNNDLQSWDRLVSAARRAPSDSRDVSAPYGFSSRLAALAMAQPAERPWFALFDRVSLRAVGVAAALALASVVTNLTPVLKAFDDDFFAAQDPVVEVLALDLS